MVPYIGCYILCLTYLPTGFSAGNRRRPFSSFYFTVCSKYCVYCRYLRNVSDIELKNLSNREYKVLNIIFGTLILIRAMIRPHISVFIYLLAVGTSNVDSIKKSSRLIHQVLQVGSLGVMVFWRTFQRVIAECFLRRLSLGTFLSKH